MNNKINSLLKLEIIKANIDQSKSLVLSENILGQNVIALLKQSLHQQWNAPLKISKAQNIDSGNNYLIFSGTFEDLYPWKNITVYFCLYDYRNSNVERHTVFRVHIPENSNAYSFLSQYSLAFDESLSSSEVAINTDLVDFIQNINFSLNTIVFSSLDCSQNEQSSAHEILRKWILPPEMADNKLEKGVNFVANISLNKDLEKYLYAYTSNGLGELLNEIITGNDATVQYRSIAYEDQCSCLIYPIESYNLDTGSSEYIPHFKFKVKPKGIRSQGISFLKLEYREISQIIPLVRGYASGPLILISGAVEIGNINDNRPSVSFSIEGILHSYHQQIVLSFRDFPTLRQLIQFTENGQETRSLIYEYFPEPLGRLLDLKLSELRMVLGLHDQSIASIAFSVTTEDEIPLIQDNDKIIISLRPTLSMQINAPLETEYRSIEGELKGTWQLGDTKFDTVLYYPSFSFSAGMTPGQSLDVGEAIKTILSGIDLPKPNIKLTQMEIWGNFRNKCFTAEIGVQDNWEFTLAGRAFGLQITRLIMAYDNQQVSGAIEGALKLADVDVFISAQYADAAQGWMLSGGTAIGAKINLTAIVNDLLESMALPERLPKLELTNIIFSATPKLGEYSLSGQTAEAWPLMDNLTLQIEEFVAEKRQGLSVTGLLRVSVTIAGIIMRLKAEKAATVAGGWKFEGSSGEGQKLPIGTLVGWMGKVFGEVTLPSALEQFTIENLAVSFNTQSRDFTFTCEGKLPLIADKPPIEAKVTIDIDNQRNDKRFGGQLIVYPEEGQPLYFTLYFHKEPTAQTFLATYYEPEGRQIGVDALLSEVFKENIATGLRFTLKDALFAYSKREPSANLLFGLGMGLDIDLSKLPLVGPLIVQMLGGRTVGIQDLRLLVARLAFSRQDVDALNRLMPAGIPALPLPTSAQAEQSVALDRGLHVSATLNLGGAPQPLALPTSAPSVPPARDGGVRRDAAPGDQAIKPSDSAKWFSIDQTLGPFHLQRLGVAWKDQRLWFLLDASLDLMGLTLGLAGLGVSLPLADPKPERLQFDLQGLEIGFKQGPVEISGGLLRVGNAYTGMALLKTEAFTITGIGSYTQIEGVDSLFIYAVLDRDLGGPVFFHVTGLAAGFGYNRALTLPPIDQVQAFPLVEVAMHPKALRDLSALSAKIDRFLTPAQGQYWLAVGVRFSSFELIESFAMLTVAFGTETTIAILGLSKITIPKPPGLGAEPPPTPMPPIAYAELAIKVQLQPERGVLMAEARLTPNSYLFTKECHLTGGFAFYVWFGKHERAGDFVVTLGGYHPKFVVPPHYPVVPRVGLNWQVSPNLAVQGELYFALTPTCLMAGGRLGALYRQGGLQAWFEAYVDALIVWEPLHYEMEAGIRLGASYYADFLGVTLSLEMAAIAHFWGPPFAGKVDITWAILSFTIYFSESQSPAEPEPLKWKPFQDAFLPRATPESGEPDPLTIAITRGLIQEVKDGDGYVIVNPHQLRLRVVSAVPSRTITMNGHTFSDACTLGIRPMGIDQLKSHLTVALKHAGQEAKNVTPAAIYQNVPGALWSAVPFDRKKERQETELIRDALIGVQCEPVAPQLGQDVVTLDDPQALYTPMRAESCAWEYAYAVTAADYDPREVRTHIQTPSPTVRNTRQTILNNLADSRLFAPPLEVMTQAVDAASRMVLCAPPVECGLGMLPNTRG
jgi:hypothetical protein